jgi:hypothetical protein
MSEPTVNTKLDILGFIIRDMVTMEGCTDGELSGVL